VTVLGHSWGGILAMKYAIAHPDRVSRLILVDSMPPRLSHWAAASDRFDVRLEKLRADGLVPEREPADVAGSCNGRVLAVLPVYYADPHHPAAKSLAGTQCASGIFGWTMAANRDLDLRPALENVTTPTLVVYGDADPFGAKELMDEVSSAFKRAPVTKKTYRFCGHIPWEECPEPFYEDVTTFLSR
jgi:proline iminopeptidase